MAPLAYLKKVLGFVVKEWSDLDESDKEKLRQWAREEMEALGIAQ